MNEELKPCLPKEAVEPIRVYEYEKGIWVTADDLKELTALAAIAAKKEKAK